MVRRDLRIKKFFSLKKSGIFNPSETFSTLEFGRLAEYIFVIPEEFTCDLTEIQKSTFFGYEWGIYAENFDAEKSWKAPCNNGNI